MEIKLQLHWMHVKIKINKTETKFFNKDFYLNLFPDVYKSLSIRDRASGSALLLKTLLFLLCTPGCLFINGLFSILTSSCWHSLFVYINKKCSSFTS